MKRPQLFPTLLAAAVVILVSIACGFSGELSETPGLTPSEEQLSTLPPVAETSAPVQPSVPPSETLITELPATEAPTPALPVTAATPTAAPTTAPEAASPTTSPAVCSDPVCTISAYFLFERPVGLDARRQVDISDRFGSYHRRLNESNHGVTFLNSTGTPVLAAAAGTVVVAGDDTNQFYSKVPNQYGNLVVLQHDLPGVGQPVFTLYAHLSQVSVSVDQAVTAGQEIGRVGMSGSVAGSTLHFEVRLGENLYEAARNPELWLKPLLDENGQSLGALAGRVVNSQGELVVLKNILVERLGGPGQPAIDQIYLKTYADKHLAGLDPWQESFAASDLVPGSYQVSFWLNDFYQQVVDVLPGQLTFITFTVP